MQTPNMPPKGLYKKGNRIALPAATITAGEIVIPQQRGNVEAISIVVGGPAVFTTQDLNDVIFTLSNNGESFIENDTLLRWSSDYRNDKIIIIPITLGMGGTLNFTFDNQSAVALSVNLEAYFYNPSEPSM